MNREQFIAYLRTTLIPDLRETGMTATAADFEACCLFMEGAEEIEIDYDTDHAVQVA